MLMDVAGPEPIREVTNSFSDYIPYIIVGVLLVIGVVVTIYMVRKASKKDEKNNK